MGSVNVPFITPERMAKPTPKITNEPTSLLFVQLPPANDAPVLPSVASVVVSRKGA
jgi:hypothetical protein